jgi:hypothetical protein
MNIIKRKIFLEDNIDRTYNSPNWGVITATTFYVKVLLTQNMDDMGLFTDVDYVPNITGQTNTNVTNNEVISLRLPSKSESDYYYFGNLQITGATDSKIDNVKTYSALEPYIIGFDINTETYINYSGESINGVDRVKSLDNPYIYVFDTPNDINLGTNSQTHGLQYLDYTGDTRQVDINGVLTTIPLTTMKYIGEGFNETNTSLSAITKQEYLFGIISSPEVESDIFIDRGATTVMDMHLRLSEIKNLGQLTKYGNGFYNINKQ